MDNEQEELIVRACHSVDCDAGRLLDILWTIQDARGCIDEYGMERVAQLTGTHRVVVEGVVTFYHFFTRNPTGRIAIYLCDDIIDRFAGLREVEEAFTRELGIRPGQVTADGLFSLHHTPFIGLGDQAPAALINAQVATRLTPARVPRLLALLRRHGRLPSGFPSRGEGNNALPLIAAGVRNNIRLRGPLLSGDHEPGAGLRQALRLAPAQIIACVRDSGLRGRGGAGFHSADKLQLAAATEAPDRVVICNADEGEPGTFKDRVLLTERVDLLLEGMTICARAIGARQGIIYLRAEYRYLENWLKDRLRHWRRHGRGAMQAAGNKLAVDFDIRIQRGAGAYVCGEESAVIRSCEGARGEPTSRPPFPAQRGYRGLPTVVQNVETFCCIARLLAEGAQWFAAQGTVESTGTKLFSVSGDCARPGIYELPFGPTVAHLLRLCGARNPAAVAVGGACGQVIGAADFGRRLCFEDMPTAGAVMVFDQSRDVLGIAKSFTDFFVEESCGYCTPCRVGNVFLQDKLDRILRGLGEPADLAILRDLAETIIQTSRCGLGHTSPNPILSTIAHFPEAYATRLKSHPDGRQAGFDLDQATAEARRLASRIAIHPESSAS